MTSSTEYISASCNRAINVSDCRLDDGLVAFGSGRFVALWHSNSETCTGVFKTLSGHQADVTAVQFVTNSVLLVGDASGTVKVWREHLDNDWKCDVSLGGHAQSISALAAIRHPADSNKIIVVTGGSEGSVQIWIISEGQAECVQRFELKGKIPLTFALSCAPGSKDLLLAIGSTQSSLLLYTAALSANLAFSKCLSIPGHTDWIRCLDFISPQTSVDYDLQENEILLASGSQDSYIRLWRFKQSAIEQKAKRSALDALDDLETSLDDIDGEIKLKSHDFKTSSQAYSCTSESVLLGHDSWITGIRWSPPSLTGGQLCLLSSSSDRSMILWTPSLDPTLSASVWTSTQRFGEFSSQTNLGFFDARWGKDAATVLAHGWGGSYHVWRKSSADAQWQPVVPITGHYEPVKSLSWEPKGQYLLSGSLDMSARLHSVWQRDSIQTWHEIARPQIHGYPIQSVAFVDRLRFVSGADEKIVRVFDATKLFLSSMKQVAGLSDLGDEKDRPLGASVPPLGLSNRAIAGHEEASALGSTHPDDPFDSVPTNFDVAPQPPFEEQLLGSTLWPEIEKLYGHGYEIMTVASAHATPLIATACRATSAEHATVRLFDARTWRQVGPPLAGHSLTITKVAFSPDDKYLLSVSRDRSWHIYELQSDGSYVHSATASKPHARIIWDGAWSTDSALFATASRDKTVKVWQTGSWQCLATMPFDEAATALAFTRRSESHVLAVGLENGLIEVFVSADGKPWSRTNSIGPEIGHVLAVNALAFRPTTEQLQLASASEDRTVRLFTISRE